MAGFFTSLFGGGNRRRRQTPVMPGPSGSATQRVGSTPLRTDNRKPTKNAVFTGRKAVPRGSAQDPNAVTPTPPNLPTLIPDPIAAAQYAAYRQRRKGRTQRASSLLGGTGSSANAVLQPRTLIGY